MYINCTEHNTHDGLSSHGVSHDLDFVEFAEKSR